MAHACAIIALTNTKATRPRHHMAEYDIIIIGAGISGLSLAHYCAKAGLKTVVIEKSSHVGGAIDSHMFKDAASGFWLEMGAHTCYNSYSNLIGVLEDDSALARLIPREKAPFKMLIDNEVKSIPSQLSFPSLLPAALRLFTLKKEGRSVEQYYSKLAGRRNYERVLSNAFNAVVSQNADDFPADMLFKKRTRRKDVLRKFTFANGLQGIADVISAEEKIELVTDRSVRTIARRDDGFSVTADSGELETKRLAIATPASVASELLSPAFPEISTKLALIKVNKVESLGIVVKKDATPLPAFANLIAADDIFYSVVSRDVVPDASYRGFTFHFKPGVADEAAKMRRVSEILRVPTAKVAEMFTKENMLPSLTVGQRQLVAEIDSLTRDKNLFLTGNYFYGLSIEDCVTRSLTEFDKLVAD